VLVGKLSDRTADSLSRRAVRLVRGSAAKFETLTADNGTESQDYGRAERRTGAVFYFARPYHSRERGSDENASGLMRQWPPKGESMAVLTRRRCKAIAGRLDTRPRKRLGFRTPLECFDESSVSSPNEGNTPFGEFV